MDMFDRIIAREGGSKVTNDPVDPGGVTKYGISSRAYPKLDVATITEDMAKGIYVNDYYLKNSIQLLPDWLQEAVFDWTVHSGSGPSIKTLQRLLNVEVDGKIGPMTAKAARLASRGLLYNIAMERMLFLIKQVEANPHKIKYLRGWLSRVWSLL